MLYFKETLQDLNSQPSNSVKDLTYIQELLKDFPEAEKIAEDNKNYFQKAVDDGYGENFISELIDKK
jgi:3-hydroxyisobutyrate dehydrogenase-like beta-hydroxyacid dehydrogenase